MPREFYDPTRTTALGTFNWTVSGKNQRELRTGKGLYTVRRVPRVKKTPFEALLDGKRIGIDGSSLIQVQQAIEKLISNGGYHGL